MAGSVGEPINLLQNSRYGVELVLLVEEVFSCFPAADAGCNFAVSCGLLSLRLKRIFVNSDYYLQNLFRNIRQPTKQTLLYMVKREIDRDLCTRFFTRFNFLAEVNVLETYVGLFFCRYLKSLLKVHHYENAHYILE